MRNLFESCDTTYRIAGCLPNGSRGVHGEGLSLDQIVAIVASGRFSALKIELEPAELDDEKRVHMKMVPAKGDEQAGRCSAVLIDEINVDPVGAIAACAPFCRMPPICS